MATLTPQQADLLLEKLSTDADFHALFQSDPASAINQIGLPAEFAPCATNITLASQEVIRATRQSLTADLTSTLDQNVIGLNAS